MATAAQHLSNIKNSLLASLAAETAYQEAHGPKPSYSLDGESYSWAEWRTAVLAQVGELNLLIQQEAPFCIVSRGRS